MKTIYANWIKANVKEAYGKCAEVTLEMQAAFPDQLERVRGQYHCLIWGERDHWWLIDIETGEVVDPTASQFPSKGGEYVEWDESQPEPRGKCPNCGGKNFTRDYLCSDKCAKEYVAYCSRPIGAISHDYDDEEEAA